MWETIERIIVHFGLGKLLGVRQAGGYTNANYFVATDRGDYLVKIERELGDVEDFRAVQRFLERLAAEGFRVIPYLRDAAGEFLYREDGIAATVQPKLDASAPESLTADMAAQVGAELARLHLVPHEGLPERRNWLHSQSLARAADVVREKLKDIEGAGELIEAFGQPRPAWDRLPQAITHGDLYADNTLFQDGKLACFIDWEEVCVDAAVLDFGTAVVGCCFPDSRFDPDLYGALIRSYEGIRRFSEEERAEVTAAVRYSAMACALWRLVNRDRLGDRYKRYWTQGLDRWQAP